MKLLPDNPSIEHLRREARALKSRHRVKDDSVCKIIGHFDTSLQNLSHEVIFTKKFSILDAQRVTARQYSFSSWARLKLFVDKSTQKTDQYDSSLRNQLLRRKQACKALFKRARKKKWKFGTRERFDEFNRESGDELRVIYQRHGWPGPDIVGRDGVEAAYWLAANNPYDSEFQYQTAELLKNAMSRGDCYGIQYAVIIDRWSALSYKPSVFGTSVDFHVENGRVELSRNVIDPCNLNRRRAEVGLDNFEQANRKMIEELIPRSQLMTDKSDWESYKRKLALKGGYI